LPIVQGLKAQRKTAAWDTTTISRLFNYKLMTFFDMSYQISRLYSQSQKI